MLSRFEVIFWVKWGDRYRIDRAIVVGRLALAKFRREHKVERVYKL